MSKQSREQKKWAKDFNREHDSWGFLNFDEIDPYKKIPRKEMCLRKYRKDKKKEKRFYKEYEKDIKDFISWLIQNNIQDIENCDAETQIQYLTIKSKNKSISNEKINNLSKDLEGRIHENDEYF